ncbi:MAG: phenylacetate--CoA ligase family protein [Pirellulales bacterium]|nr:phenylacetate--CoA ligase family protein [Pirellulales bacterium]
MTSSDPKRRRELVSLDRQQLAAHQLERLNRLLGEILPQNAFYYQKLGRLTLLDSLEQLADLPLTDKSELMAASDGWAANHTFAREHYVHCHQTSGTQGRPLLVLDTAEDWQWWNEGWQYVLDAAELTGRDVCMLAFSFGPFIGFWTAFDAAVQRGCLTVPGGGLTTIARLEQMQAMNATCLFCTPSYALHMAEVAAERGIDLHALPIRCLILAGEPGGSVPSVRTRLEQLWDARILDHCGATEVGPWGFGNLNEPGLHVNEAAFIAEFLTVETGQAAEEGELAELVLTSLGRSGAPVIRYRTGDRVRPVNNHDRRVRFVWLDGGVLGRADDMMIIRGVNLFPSSVECIVREFPEIIEYRMTATKAEEMDQLLLEIEDRKNQPQRLAEALQARLGLRVEVRQVPSGTLPRFEAKGKRFIDQR